MELDINTLRSAVTVLSFIAFIGILYWTLSKRHTADFAEAAKLPFDQD
jgi:cytochrome c oxidase cbb3-type subunit IV